MLWAEGNVDYGEHNPGEFKKFVVTQQPHS